MRDKDLPSRVTHLEKLIDSWVKSNPSLNLTASRGRRLLVISALAAMLTPESTTNTQFLAFKGGAAMEFRFGADARATRDVDAVTMIDLAHAFQQIDDALQTGWLGFTATRTADQEITRAGIQPAPRRCKIKLAYKDRPFATVDFELSRAETETVSYVESITNAIDLTAVRFPALGSRVAVMNVHYQIAQKLHACTEITVDAPNQRVHDLYDILLLADLARADGLMKTNSACLATFSHRAKQTWPPVLQQSSDWNLIWDRLDIPTASGLTYQIARDAIEKLIDEIDRAGGAV
jgi:hypothetical protein